jgi:hypothetical protein
MHQKEFGGLLFNSQCNGSFAMFNCIYHQQLYASGIPFGFTCYAVQAMKVVRALYRAIPLATSGEPK